MARILVGTSGYSYADWVGPVYPEGTRAADYLDHYARRLEFVELNFSFYRQPEAATLAKLRDRVPPGFRFAAKAHRTLTHEPGDVEADAARFLEGLAPIRESGQLTAVLVQFPYSFHYAPAARRHLDRVCRALEGVPLAVELRGADWQRDSVTEELARRAISQVWVDLPPLEGLPDTRTPVTSPLGYLRLHGRNRETWWTGTNITRYDYRYTQAQLGEWAERLRKVLEMLSHMVIAFNNHYRGQAVDNALELRAMMQGGVTPA